MRITKLLVRTAAVGATAIGAVATLAPDSAVGRAARRTAQRLSRDVRYAVASAPGILYRLAGRQPDPNVPDDILADRIRSAIGPLERRLDVPRVHVMVEDHVAILHGDVPAHAAALIERAVLRVSGVEGVESHLHHGLIPGDTRPSEGREVEQPSPALTALLDAAHGAGATDPKAAVHAVLCAFGDRVPAGERAHMEAHLSADVRRVIGSGVHRHGDTKRVRSVSQLVAAVASEGGVEPERADEITRAVVTTLRGLVPDEAADIAAVLPAELRQLWTSQPASTS